MSESSINDAFLTIVALPPEVREGELRRLEDSSPETAAEVRRMLQYYREEPETTALDEDESSASEPLAVETFPPPRDFVERRSGAPRIAGYRIVEPIDHGGQSTVYLAEQVNPRRLVAVKVLRLAILDPRARDRFLAEAQLQGTIRHPAIVGIHACGVVDETGRPLPWIAMELVPGARSIIEAAKADGWDRRRRLEALATVAEAIHAAHLRGVVHRDLKPGNILVDGEGRVRVIDFGIARLLDSADGESLTRAGELVGTIRYLAPEQLRGDQIDARADIHALGTLAYELLHERSPWGNANSTSSVIAAIERHEIAHPKARHRTDRDLNAVLGQALAASPADRYESMAAFARDLRAVATGNRVDARPATTLDELRRFAARHPLPVGLSLMLVIAIVVGLIATARTAAIAQANLSRGLVSQINSAISRGDLQMARKLLDGVPPQHRRFEYHMLAAEAMPTMISRRPAWSALSNLYEIVPIAGERNRLAIAAGGGRLAVLGLGTDILMGELKVRPRPGEPPIGEIVRVAIDRSSGGSPVRLAGVTSDGIVACFEVDLNALGETITPKSEILRPDRTESPVICGIAFIDGELAVGRSSGRIDLHPRQGDDDWAIEPTPTRHLDTGLSGAVTAITPLADGRLVVGTSLGRLEIVAADGRPIATIAEGSRSIRNVSISPDGRRFVACAGRTLVCGDLEGRDVQTIEGPGLFWDASFSPTSNHVAITGRDGRIQFLSTDDWSEVMENRDARGITWSSHWEPGRLIVTTERDGVISVSTDGIDGGGADSRLLAMSPSTRFTLRQSEQQWVIRDGDDQVIAAHIGQGTAMIAPNSVQAATIRDGVRDDSTLVAAVAIAGRGIVGIDGTGRQHLLTTEDSPIREIALASDGRRILWRTEHPFTRIGRFDESGHFHHQTLQVSRRAPESEHARDPLVVGLFDFGPDGIRIGTEDDRVIDPEGRVPSSLFESPSPDDDSARRIGVGWILSVVGDLEGTTFIGNQNGEVSRWDAGVASWRTESRRSKVVDLALHPDGERVVALHSNGWIDILDTSDGTVVGTLGPIDGEPVDVAITPDGRTMIAHAVDGRHRIWTQGDDTRSVIVPSDR